MTKELELAMSDLTTIHKLNTIPDYKEKLQTAIREYHILQAYRIDIFYIYQPFSPNLQGFSFEQMEFISRMNNEEYKKLLLNTYNQLTEKTIDENDIPKTYFKIIK